jgi:hypothetical protein
VGRQHHGVGGDDAPIGGEAALVDGDGTGVFEHAAAGGLDRVGEAEAELAGVELRLAVQADRGLDGVREVGVGGQLDGKAGSAGGVGFGLDRRYPVGGRGVGEGGGVLEVAVDAVGVDEVSYAGKSCLVGGGVDACSFRSPGVDETGVDRRLQCGDLGGRVAGDPGAQLAGVDDEHAATGVLEEPSGCQPCDAGADHDDVGMVVSRQRSTTCVGRRADPQRRVSFVDLPTRSPIFVDPPTEPYPVRVVIGWRRDHRAAAPG